MDQYRAQESVCSDLLAEVIDEFSIELITEDLLQSDSSTTLARRDKHVEDSMVKECARSILNEVVAKEAERTSKAHFDIIVKNHSTNMEAVQRFNFLLNEVTSAMIEEILIELIQSKTSKQHRNQIFEQIMIEVVTEESADISGSVLDHYGSRLALSQYKQMQNSAANMILDKAMLHSLIMQYQPEKPTNGHTSLEVVEGNIVLDSIMLEILLAQSLALHNCFPNKKKPLGVSHFTVPPAGECIPIKWYKKKITAAIAEDVIVSMLCERLDESMQMVADKQMENQVVSLFHNYLDEPETI